MNWSGGASPYPRRIVRGFLFMATLLLVCASCELDVRAQEMTVTATKYSCEYHVENKMATTEGFCEITRWGADPSTRGVACPVDWRDWWLWVPGQGVLKCDDTSSASIGGDGTLGGFPHVDVRVATYAEAARYGVQTIRVRRLFIHYRERLNPSAREGRGPE